MRNSLALTLAVVVAFLVSGCALRLNRALVSSVPAQRMQVRTTAYTRSEGTGCRNAIGTYLSGRHVQSAASDWSRFPLGTRFRIVDTTEEYVIDDYGTALVGTNTIDLYKPTRLEMKQWGVRHVSIDVLQWGSREESLKVLAPRSKHRIVRQMILALQKKSSSASAKRAAPD